MEPIHYITSAILDLDIIRDIIDNNMKLALSEEARLNITKSRKYLDQKITTWDPIMIVDHEIIYDNLSNDGVLNIGDLANISLTIQNNDNNNPYQSYY